MGSNKMLLFVVIFVVMKFVQSQVFLPGSCPNVHPMENFDPERFVGLWSVISGAGHPYYENLVACDTFEFEADHNRLTRLTLHTVIRSTGEIGNITGRIMPVGGPTSAELLVSSPRSTLYPTVRHFTILDTDYDHWAAIVACSNYGNIHVLYEWVMSRNRTLDAEKLKSAQNLMEQSTGLPANDFYMRNQENCPAL